MTIRFFWWIIPLPLIFGALTSHRLQSLPWFDVIGGTTAGMLASMFNDCNFR